MTHEFIIDAPLEPAGENDPKLERFKREHGCVIRTFESIAGAQATQEEYYARIRQMLIFALGRANREINGGVGLDAISAFEEEQGNIEDLFQELQSHDTPLGISLSTMSMMPVFTTIEQHERFIDGGKKVAIVLPKHMFHLGKIDGSLVRLSDNSQPVGLPSNPYSPYHGFIFSHRLET